MFIDADSFHINVNTLNGIEHNGVACLGHLHDCILKEIKIIPNTKDAYIEVYSEITKTTLNIGIGGLIGVIYAGECAFDSYFELNGGDIEHGEKYVKPIDLVLAQNEFPFTPRSKQEMSKSIAFNLHSTYDERIVILCESVSYEPEEGEESKWNALRPKR